MARTLTMPLFPTLTLLGMVVEEMVAVVDKAAFTPIHA
jgi:hypothetical protein